MSKLLWNLFLKPTSSAGRISSTSVLTVPSDNWRQIRVCSIGEKRMALCDVLALFTTPIHSSFKDTISGILKLGSTNPQGSVDNVQRVRGVSTKILVQLHLFLFKKIKINLNMNIETFFKSIAFWR